MRRTPKTKTSPYKGQTPEDIYRDRIAHYKSQMQQLEGFMNELESTTTTQQVQISDLQHTLIALTEENIHLKAKNSLFRDSKELQTGIEQTTELMSTITPKSSMSFSSPDDQNHSKRFPQAIQELQSQDLKKSFDLSVCTENSSQRSRKKRSGRRALLKKCITRNTQAMAWNYVPTYLRKLTKKD